MQTVVQDLRNTCSGMFALCWYYPVGNIHEFI